MAKVLIVEDSKPIAIALSARLTAGGFEPILAHDADTGIAAALEHRPRVVLLDITLPGGGLTVAQALRDGDTHIPIIFLTASKDPKTIDEAARFNPAGFFEKPYDAHELMRAIRATAGMD